MGDPDRRVAVIGSGITGLSAAWLLHRSGIKVTLYEKATTCGGHTWTDESLGFPVDLGFQVFNLSTYPNFVGFLEQLRVDSEPSDMSFACSVDGGRVEWGSDGLAGIFAQRKNILSPSHWCMVWDVIRFGRQAPKVLEPDQARLYARMSMGEYLQRNGYSRAFQDNYVLPMCAAVWSVPNSQVLAFPVVMLVRFWVNHHLLELTQRPIWRVVKDRSRSYVDRVLQDLKDVRLGTEVVRVKPAQPGGHATVEVRDGSQESFDAVLLATHSDTSLHLLADQAPQGVEEVLGAIPYGTNQVYLHTDPSLMARNRQAWASWNFIGAPGNPETTPVCVTYWVNRLQRIPADAPETFVTLNPPQPPAPDRTALHVQMAHPIFSFASLHAQSQLPNIQGRGSIYYAGAWCGYGFHEDGMRAGIAAAQALGASIPWEPISCNPRASLLDFLYMALFTRFARQAITVGHLRIILPNGAELEFGAPPAADQTKPAAQRASLSDEESWHVLPPSRATMRLFKYDFFRRIVTRHDVGLGESYMHGDFEVDDLGALLALLTANVVDIQASRGALGLLNWLGDGLLRLAHATRANTLLGSRSNIAQHYDAGNDMYKLFLDPSMTYSSAVFRHPGEALERAQMNKLDDLIAQAGICASDHVLDIGFGWGSGAIRAVQTTGCRVTGLTLSKQQLQEASERVERAGLSNSITLLFCDYRDLPSTCSFDKVVSCEMVEAVGHEHLPAYFHAIGRVLKPGGKAAIQAICTPDDRYDAYRRSSDFIREHIFSGGHLPCVGAMVDAAVGTGLSLSGLKDIGLHYATTLRAWRQAWEAKKADALALGYDATFWRKYRFYFAYCEAGFDARYLHNFQVTWTKTEDTRQAEQYRPRAEQQPAEDTRRMDPSLQGQIVQSLYFFLAGVVVSKRHLLLLGPAACFMFGLLRVAIAWTASQTLPSFRSMTPEAKAWWSADVVHLLYGVMAAVAAVSYLVASGGHALDLHWQAEAAGMKVAADALVCISAGFCAFFLWTIILHRLYKQSPLATLHYTILLMWTTAAAYKSEHTPFLACLLISQLYSIFNILHHLFGLMQTPRPRLQRTLQRLQLITLPICCLLPQLAALRSILSHRTAFRQQSYFWLAVAGILWMLLVSCRKLRDLSPRKPTNTALHPHSQ